MDTDSSPLPPRPFLDIEQCFFTFSCRSALWRPDGANNFLLGHPNADSADPPWLNMPWSACTTKKKQSNYKSYDLLHHRSRALLYGRVKSDSFTFPPSSEPMQDRGQGRRWRSGLKAAFQPRR